MAHRGPLREVFLGITFLLLAKKAEKTISPTHTSFIMDAADEIAVAQNVTVQPHHVTPSDTGFLHLLFAFLLSDFSDIVEEVLMMAVMEVLAYCLLPAVLFFKRSSISALRFARHLVRLSRVTERETDGAASDATRAEDGVDVACDPIKTHPSQAETPNDTPFSPTSDQFVANLRAEAAEKDVQIAALTQAANEKSKTILDISRRNDNLFGNLRATLDPNGLYKSNPDLFVVAKDFTRDFDRVSRKLERQREEVKKAQQRDTQISTLSAKNTRLAADLKRHIREAAEEAEWAKEEALREQTKLKKRASDAESAARQARSPREYDLLRGQLDEVVADLQKAQRELEEERIRTQRLEVVEKELEATKKEAEAGENRVETAEKKVDAAENNTEAAQKGAEAAEKKLEVAEEKIEAAKREAENAEKKMRASEKEAETNGKKIGEMIAEVNELRSQLANAQEQNAEVRHNEYLDGLSQNQPSDQNVETSDHTLSGHGREKETTSQEDELRGQIDQLTAANSNLQLARANQQTHTRNEIDKALADERLEAQRVLGESQQQLREQLSGQWAGESQRLQDTVAEIRRLNEVGRGVEQRLNNTVDELDGVRQQLSNTQAINAQQTFEIRQLQEGNNDFAKAEGELKEAKKYATRLYNNGTKQWERAEAAEKRAKEAEAEIEKYKRGKQDQDGRIKEMKQRIMTLERKISPNADLEAAEFDAVANSRVRACTIIEEFVNRHYDFPTRGVLVKLMEANDKIDELKVMLKNPATRSSRKIFLDILDDAEVDKDQYKALTYSKRQVVVRQCAAVNAKLAALRYIIKGSGQPNKDQLLAEIYKPRGDEQAVWDDQTSEPEPESDEDDDGNDGDDGDGGRAVHPFEPLPARSRKKPSQQPEGHNTPMPSNPNSNNPLKRKINPDDNESEGLGKRHIDSDIGMRPIAGPFPQPSQQGSSTPEADIDQSETKKESQDDLPSSERIGEAAAPQIQSNDQTNLSPQAPSSPLSSSQNFSSTQITPATWSATSLQVDHPFHLKPTKIPGPKAAEAHLTPSEQREGLAIRERQDKNVAPAQSSVPFTGEGSTGFSFSAPRHISSGILPHVREYTRLSKTTNNVLSRHRQTNPGTTKP